MLPRVARKALLSLSLGVSLLVAAAYPAHWWTPVSEANKPEWEILPQSAKPGEVILSKRNELGILSNFAATPFNFQGYRYASVEGFWQMMLYPEGPSDPRATLPGLTWKYTREQVSQMTAFAAKAAGDLAEQNMRAMKIDWVTFNGNASSTGRRSRQKHYQLILGAMKAKLAQNPEVKRTLLATGNLTLLPDHYQEENPPAEWMYYKLWMEIRAGMQPHN